MKKVAFLLVFLMTNVLFADTKPDGTPEVPKDVVIELPGAGPDIVEEVPYIVQRVHEFTPNPGNLFLRGGLSIGLGFPARTDPSLTGGLIGQIGYTDSAWVLEASFRGGKCKGGVALDGGLAAMRHVVKHLRAGVGVDALYCSNVSDYRVEKASERVVGGSFHLQLEFGHLSVTGSVGGGAATFPVPGDRQTKFVSYQGLTIGYLF
jgi:hypothetical protein